MKLLHGCCGSYVWIIAIQHSWLKEVIMGVTTPH